MGREEEIALFQIAYQKPEELDWKYIDILTESKKPYYLFFSLYIAYQHSILKEQMQEAENYKSKMEQSKHLVPYSFQKSFLDKPVD